MVLAHPYPDGRVIAPMARRFPGLSDPRAGRVATQVPAAESAEAKVTRPESRCGYDIDSLALCRTRVAFDRPSGTACVTLTRALIFNRLPKRRDARDVNFGKNFCRARGGQFLEKLCHTTSRALFSTNYIQSARHALFPKPDSRPPPALVTPFRDTASGCEC